MGSPYQQKTYQQKINFIIKHHNYLFLDNIFPNAVHFFYDLRSPLNDPSPLILFNNLTDFWRDILKNNDVFVPRQIYQQLFKGYECLEKAVLHQKESGNLPEKFCPFTQGYLNNFFSLLKESRENIFVFPSKENETYNNYLDLIKSLSQNPSFKKVNHKKDNNADESLIAAALFKSGLEDKVCAILTNDHDIESLLFGYYQQHNPSLLNPARLSKSVVVYHPPAWKKNYDYAYVA